MIHKPNVNLPLVPSYNQRGLTGYTHTITDGIDQRRVNCVYEVIKNAATQTGTVYLSKRPGPASGFVIAGVTQSDIAYKIIEAPGTTLRDSAWAFTSDLSTVKAMSSSTVTTILSAAGYWPAFADRTLISNVDTIVVQLLKNDVSLAQRVFYGSVIGTWTEITDADFTALIHRGKIEHMKGYAFVLDSLNRIWNSDLNSVSSWTAANFFTKQVKQDFPRGLMKLNNQILAFGDETVEAYYIPQNPQATGSPLLPIDQLAQRVGVVAGSANYNSSGAGSLLSGSGDYYATLQNRLYFLGRRGGGYSSVAFFMYDGSQFHKISTLAIEKILSELSSGIAGSTFGPYSINTISYSGQWGVSILLTSPTTSPARWLMYFPDWDEWFEWTSIIFLPINSGSHFLSVQNSISNFQTYNFSSSGDIYSDGGIGGTNYQWSTQFKLPRTGDDRKRMLEFGVLGDTARAANSITVEASDNDDQSFFTLGSIDMTSDLKMVQRGGTYRGDRTIRLSNTNGVETRLQAFIARVK